MEKLNLIWKKFWKLFVIEFTFSKNRYSYRRCKCDCWNECIVKWTRLKALDTQSCWCIRKQNARIHWYAKTRFYIIYHSAEQRCNNQKCTQYRNYWMRWIKMLWKSFEEFRNDMHQTYLEHCKKFWEKDTTIERINNDWSYCKDNCTRATNKEQRANQRK